MGLLIAFIAGGFVGLVLGGFVGMVLVAVGASARERRLEDEHTAAFTARLQEIARDN